MVHVRVVAAQGDVQFSIASLTFRLIHGIILKSLWSAATVAEVPAEKELSCPRDSY